MTLKELSTIFDEIGWKHTLREDDKVIVSIGGNSTSDLMFFTRLGENGEMFDMSGRIMEDSDQLNGKDSQYKSELMSYLLLRNYETKFGTWEFNLEDGVISIAVEIPLEDNKLTAKQLKRITNMLNTSGDEADTIKQILKSGTYSKEDDSDDMIAELEAMLALLKASEGSKESDEEGI
jgi:hypothetical protein